MTKRLAISALFVAASAWAGGLLAAPCPAHISAQDWVKAFEGAQPARAAFLDTLKTCVPGNKALQQEVDDLAVDSFDALGRMDEGGRRPFAEFATAALLINAQAGFPSSQHNYAAAHNADPHGLLHLYVPQDMPTFMYWTRAAAAQKEPRALFNLAVRLASPAPPAGVAPDLPTAYIVFSYLQRTHTGLPPEVMRYVAGQKTHLAKRLGAATARRLDNQAPSFDFTKLAPASPAPGPEHGRD